MFMDFSWMFITEVLTHRGVPGQPVATIYGSKMVINYVSLLMLCLRS